MIIYSNLDKILNLESLDIDYSNYKEQVEPVDDGWNNSKTFRKAVSEGMKEYHSSDAGKKKRKRLAIEHRKRSDEFIVKGNAGNTHSEETKNKIGASCKKRMTPEQKSLMYELYNKNIGIKTIARQIGFSPTIVRRYCKP